jgi:DNA primase
MASGAIEAVKERMDIAEVVGAKVQLRPMGRNLKGLCPFHQEKTPSFVVYPESQSYHCFGCGKSGDIFTFTMETENLDFRDSLKQLADRAGIQLDSQQQKRRDPERDRERDRLVDLNERAAGYFSNLLWTSPSAQTARDVLERRGVDRRTAEKFGIGFAPDSFDALKSHFLARDVSEDELVDAGLLSRREEDGRTWDRFRNRITFPIRDREGRAVGFGARALGDEKPKYLNSSQTAIFDKRSVLYGLEKAYDAIRRTRTIVIVEGYMDAIAAHQFGFENVVASMGTALTPNQVSSIRRYVDRVFLALDSDAAGQIATLRGIDAMRESFAEDERAQVRPGAMVRFERTLGAEIRVVLIENGKDPDELIRADPASWPRALESAIPLTEYVLTRTLAGIEPTPAARARALQDHAVPILREIGDATVLSHYVGLAARLLGFKDTEVHAAVLRGSSTRGSQRERPMLSMEKPVARDGERYLVALVLRYPQAGLTQLPLLDREDIVDARHREILDALFRVNGEIDRFFADLPEEIGAYATELMGDTEPRPSGVPSVSSKEIAPAIQRLSQQRYDARWRMIQADLQSANQEGNAELVSENLRRLNELVQRKSLFNPQMSPYFRDTRSEAS